MHSKTLSSIAVLHHKTFWRWMWLTFWVQHGYSFLQLVNWCNMNLWTSWKLRLSSGSCVSLDPRTLGFVGSVEAWMVHASFALSAVRFQGAWLDFFVIFVIAYTSSYCCTSHGWVAFASKELLDASRTWLVCVILSHAALTCRFKRACLSLTQGESPMQSSRGLR